MSQTSRKRSRKDKLVPRDCNMEAFESSQAEPYVKVMNIKTEPDWEDTEVSVNLSEPPMEFSVNIEIEEYDELDIKEEIIETHYDIDTNSSVTITHNNDNDGNDNDDMINNDEADIPGFIETQVNEEVTETVKKKRRVKLSAEEPTYKEYRINPAELKEPKEMCIADRILYIELKNCIGRNPRQAVPESRYSRMLEVAVNHSKIWYFMSKNGEYPVFYKCYPCNIAWWHLHGFWEHVKIHNEQEYRIHFEEDPKRFNTQFNIIGFFPRAHKPIILEVRNIRVSGECWQCGLDYDQHISKDGSRAVCDQCKEPISSCRMLIKHNILCNEVINKGKKQYHCTYCSIFYYDQDQYNHHMSFYHAVRSDIISLIYCKTCLLCKEKYLQFNVHNCPKKKLRTPCLFCDRRFLSATFADLHTRMTNVGNCPICHKEFRKSCMIMWHVAKEHKNNFLLAYKCILCEDLLVCLSHTNIKLHMKKMHRIKYDKRRTGAECVVLPKSYFIQNYVPIEGEPVQPIPPAVPALEDGSQNTGEDLNILEHPETVVEVTTTPVEEDETKTSNEPQSSLQTSDSQTNNDFKTTDDAAEIIITTKIKEEPEEMYYMPEKVGDTELEEVYCEIENMKEEPIDDYFTMSDEQERVEVEVVIKNEDEVNGVMEFIDDEKNLENGKPLKMYTCHKCGYIDTHKRFKWHVSNKCLQKKTKFACSMCKKSYKSFSKYLKHFYTHGVPYLACPECLQQHRVSAKLTAHVNTHLKYNFVKVHQLDGTSKKKHQCKKCTEYVEDEDFFGHWENHLNESMLNKPEDLKNVVEEPVKLVSALEPGILKILTGRLQYARYVKILTKKGCVVCSKQFRRLHDCKRHIIEHLLEDAYATRITNKQLKCQICGDGFEKSERYRYHMRVHASMALYKCEICDKSFSDSSNFTKHKKTHDVNVFICNLCNKKFLAKSSLEKHIKLHSSNNPTPCKECDRVFFSQSAYKKHVRCTHSRETLKFMCVICKVRFESLKQKWDHLWEVHKERNYIADCHICNKSFRKYRDLKNHITGEHRVHVRYKEQHRVKDSSKVIWTVETGTDSGKVKKNRVNNRLMNNRVENNSLMNNSHINNSDMRSSYLNNSEMSSSDVNNSEMSSSDVINSFFNNSAMSSSDVINSYLNNSAMSSSDVINSYLNNSEISTSDVNNSYLNNSETSISDVNNSFLNNSEISSNNVNNREIGISHANNSFFNSSDIINCDENNSESEAKDITMVSTPVKSMETYDVDGIETLVFFE